MAADEAPGALRILADPHRWRLLSELVASDHRVGELTELTGDPQNLVSYHLGRLRRAGLVSSRRSSFDGRDTYYRADLDGCARVLRQAGTALDPGLRLAAGAPPPWRGGRHRPRVLFLCTGNSGRSQMAEAWATHLSGGAVRSASAGSRPKPVHPEAVAVMAERGIDLSRHRSKHLDRFVDDHFDRVVTLCDKVREVCPELPGHPVAAHWSMPDPAAGEPGAERDAFEAAAADIEVRVRHLLARMAAEQEEPNHA